VNFEEEENLFSDEGSNFWLNSTNFQKISESLEIFSKNQETEINCANTALSLEN
jgi:hypothetical protein